jgi:hypothetical protein
MPKRKQIAAVLGCAAAFALGACGGDEEVEPSIPGDNAATLLTTLDEIEANVSEGSCVVAEGEVQEFQDELGQLPADVDQEVVDALQSSALKLSELIDEECDAPEETTTEETTTEEEPTTTEETTTEETTTQETEPTTPTQPPPPEDPGGSGGIGPGGGAGADGL